jgi:hypothetical protein
MIRTILAFSAFLLSNIMLQANDYYPEIDGWSKSELKEYNSETLWEYINGAADYYIGYGFEKLQLVEYTNKDDVYIKAEIYYHNTPLNAYGIYAYERSEGVEFIDYGLEGYIIYSSLNLVNSSCYVKINCNESTEEIISAIKTLGRSISENISEHPEMPGELLDLPKINQQEHSLKYMPENFMGYSFLENFVSAEYRSDDKKYELFVSHTESQENALSMLQKYLATFKTEASPENNTLYEVDDIFNGSVYLIVYNNKLFGVFNATISSEKIKEILTKL